MGAGSKCTAQAALTLSKAGPVPAPEWIGNGQGIPAFPGTFLEDTPSLVCHRQKGLPWKVGEAGDCLRGPGWGWGGVWAEAREGGSPSTSQLCLVCAHLGTKSWLTGDLPQDLQADWEARRRQYQPSRWRQRDLVLCPGPQPMAAEKDRGPCRSHSGPGPGGQAGGGARAGTLSDRGPRTADSPVPVLWPHILQAGRDPCFTCPMAHWGMEGSCLRPPMRLRVQLCPRPRPGHGWGQDCLSSVPGDLALCCALPTADTGWALLSGRTEASRRRFPTEAPLPTRRTMVSSACAPTGD